MIVGSRATLGVGGGFSRITNGGGVGGDGSRLKIISRNK